MRKSLNCFADLHVPQMASSTSYLPNTSMLMLPQDMAGCIFCCCCWSPKIESVGGFVLNAVKGDIDESPRLLANDLAVNWHQLAVC